MNKCLGETPGRKPRGHDCHTVLFIMSEVHEAYFFFAGNTHRFKNQLRGPIYNLFISFCRN